MTERLWWLGYLLPDISDALLDDLLSTITAEKQRRFAQRDGLPEVNNPQLGGDVVLTPAMRANLSAFFSCVEMSDPGAAMVPPGMIEGEMPLAEITVTVVPVVHLFVHEFMAKKTAKCGAELAEGHTLSAVAQRVTCPKCREML